MATKTIAWTTGSGNITLTYTGQGNGSISVASDENDSVNERSQSFDIVTTNGSPQKAVSILVKQQGKKYAVGEVFNFDYTGSVQEITLPAGKYKLQCWGAQGGNVTGTYAVNGSKGGYSEGVLTLTKTTKLYVFVGGQGTAYTSSDSQTSTSVVNGGWNGGGAGVRTSRYNNSGIDGRSYPRGGGGATDISTVTSSLSYSSGRTTRDNASLLARCIVAGGGAGASARYTSETSTTTTWELIDSNYVTQHWMDGNGRYCYTLYYGAPLLVAGTYKAEITPSSFVQCTVDGANSAGTVVVGTLTISSGSSFIIPSSWSSSTAVAGRINARFTSQQTSVSFKLYRQTSTTSDSTSSGKSSGAQQGGGTSGKGQYPGTQTSAGSGGAFGLGANQTASSDRYCSGGGGGGWYGGGKGSSDSSASYVNYSGGGSGFVNTAANAASRPSGYTGLQLDSGTTKDGSTSFESTSGGTETGHSGNGYARITVLDEEGNGGDTGGSVPSAQMSWDVKSGSWNPNSNSNAADGTAYTSVSPGSNGATVIRCTFSGVTSITFNCVYNGENNYDYLTVGSLDTECTRSSYGTSLKGTSGTARDITFSCDTGTHFVEFCYSKDGSVDTSPDNATVYIKSYS